MQAFILRLADLVPYFSSVAQISGALLGLVFVALTFNPKTLAMRHDPGLRALAEQVFADFLTVMVIALFLLIPYLGFAQRGATVALAAAVSMGRLVRSVWSLWRSQRTFRAGIFQRFWLSLLGNAAFILAGFFLCTDRNNPSAWLNLVIAPILLLTSGARSAWLLVTQSAE